MISRLKFFLGLLLGAGASLALAQQQPVSDVSITEIDVLTGKVQSVTVTSGGGGYSSAPTVVFSGAGGSGAAATATISGGVGSVAITDGGSGYLSAPVVTISGPGGGGGATATAFATITGGVVTSITVSSAGAGYTSPPTVLIASPGVVGGVTASASAVLSAAVTGVNLTNQGSRYKNFPAISFTGGGGLAASATAVMELTTFTGLVNPQNEAYGDTGATILVSALAVGTFPAGGYTYEFFVDGISIGLAPTPANGSPATIAWTPPHPGSYFITVKATGTTSPNTSLAVRYFATGTEIVSPVNNTLVPNGSSVVIQAVATGKPRGGVSQTNAFVKRVDFYADGNLIDSDSTYPYSTIYTPANTPLDHVIEAKAFDSDDIQISGDGVAVKSLHMVTPIGTPPTCVISSPTHLAAVAIPPAGTDITIAVDATSASGRIVKVELYIDGVLFGTTTSFPYGFTWHPSIVGTYKLVALGYDDKNNVVSSVANTSVNGAAVALLDTTGHVGAVSVTNVGAGYTSAPAVTISAPAITATATASLNSATGQVASFTITNGGAGYTTAPAVTISAPGGSGVTATATATIDATTGKVVGITVTTGGSLYSAVPTVTIAGSGVTGTTASATAAISGGKITGITVVSGGSGYVGVPTVTVGTPPASTAAGPTTVTIAAPPTVTITSPADFATVTGGSTTLITANATDSNAVGGVQATISSVQFFQNGRFIGSAAVPSTGSTYTTSFVPTPQFDSEGNPILLVLTALATDSLGLTSISRSISLTVTAGGNPPPPPVKGIIPVVSVTAPAPGQLAVGLPVNLTAAASDQDGQVVSVQFLVNEQVVGAADTAYPYGATWTPTNLGTYSITAKATDNDSNSVISTPITVTVVDSGTPATVSLSYPSNNSTIPVNQPTTLKTIVNPGLNAVVSVSFSINGAQVSSDTTAPYEFVWTPTNLGRYTLSATITDSVGNVSVSAPVSVTVGGSSGTTVLTSSATNALVPQGSSIVLSADVNLGQSVVKQMQFFDNGVPIGAADVTAPYAIIYSPSGGAGTTHVLTAQATDNNNTVLTASAALTISVSNAVGPLPTVTITSPRDNVKIPLPDYVADASASVTVTVDAQKSSGRITKVELYVDGELLHDQTNTVTGIKTTFPYAFTWQPLVAGTYYLVALVYDDKGNVVASSAAATGSVATPTTVIVSAPPSAAITAPADFSTVTGGSITQTTVTATSSNGYPVTVQLFFDDKYVGETTIPSAGAVRTISYTPVPRKVFDSNGNMSILPSHLYVIASDPLGFSSSTKSTALTLNVTDGGSSTGSTIVGLAPTISITGPLGGTNFPVSALVSLGANASDADGNVIQVIFYANGQAISTLVAYPYYSTWRPVNLGTYAISAKVTDNDGNTVTSTPVTVTVTDSGPSGTTVAITAPVTGSSFTVATETTLRATATDDVAVANVQFFVNSQPFGNKVLAAPYNLPWIPAAPGSYTIFARATDNVGNQATSASVVVNVTANAAPTVSLTSPAGGTTITSGNSVALAATASDSDGTIAAVKFLANSIVIGTATASPYTLAWTPSGPGTYALAAQATDDSGNITVSSTVSLTVAANQAPTASLTGPKTGTSVSVGSGVTLTATAADADGSVAKVQFYANGVFVSETSASPYQVTWTPSAEGIYRLTAVATDNAGATVTSAIVVVAAVNGTAAVDTVATGLYLNFNTSDSGDFSIVNLHGQSVTFIGYVPAVQLTSPAKVYYFANAPLDAAGNFQLTNASGAVIFSGQFSASGASGSFTDGGNSIMFGGTNTTARANAAAPGYFSGSITGHPGSFLTGFIGLDGQITVYAQDGTFADAGRAAVSPTGTFTITTRSNNVITGTADPVTGLLTGTIAKSGVPGSDSFTGAQASGSTFSDGSLRNISSRGWVGTGDNSLIAGFVVSGASPKRMLLRAVGPTLSGLGVPGALANPALYLFDHNGAPLTFNDNWGTGGTAVASTASLVGAQPLATGSLDSSILITLTPGVYSMQVSGVGSTTGIALVELYDIDSVDAFSAEKMVNISTRGFVGTGDNVLIAGFVVNGSSPKKILVRGVGPTLATVGLPNGILADPVLRIVRANGPLIRENDNWGTGNDVGLVARAASQIGAFPLVVGSKDAAILMNLPPGIYSAQLSGTGTSTGIGMIEVYEVQ